MIDADALRGAIATKGLTQQVVAERLGITPKTFYLKMKKGIFDSDEIEQMIVYLNIEHPMPIFFPNKVT